MDVPAIHLPPVGRASAARQKKPPPANAQIHYVYLAVIVVLVVIIVYFAASSYRAKEVADQLKSKYGIDAEVAGASRARPSLLRNLTAEQIIAERTFDQYRGEFDQVVERAIELGDYDDRNATGTTAARSGTMSDLQKACEMAMRGGKRLRPIILMEVARNVSKRRYYNDQMPPVDAADAALAVESLHAASLIVDDTPNFDDDEERRGNPSVWKATSPSTAMMAGMAIAMGAFQNMCRQVDWLRANCSEWINPDRVGTMLCNRVSQSMGIIGAASGQFMDMMPANKLREFAGQSPAPPTTSDGGAEDDNADGADYDVPNGAVQTLVQRKTSPFFELALVCGWLVGGGENDRQTLEDLQRAGRDFGTAFQVADDIGDLERDRARRQQGKPGWNYADAFGVDEAEAELVRRLAACRKTLVRYQLHSAIWEEIYAKVMKMTTN